VKKNYSLALFALMVGSIVIGGLYYNKHSTTKMLAYKSNNSDKKIILPEINSQQNIEDMPAVRAYLEDLQKLYKENKAVLPLQNNELDNNGKIAQNVALKDKNFLSDTKINNKLLHNDIMRVMPATQSMLDKKSKSECKALTCYVVEKYNYALNSTTKAIVNIPKKRVISVKRYSNSQPIINKRLTRISKEIAINQPRIVKELGYKPSFREISMKKIKSNLKESFCKDKNHLCVALTIAENKKKQALLAIIDLTKLKLVAIKWANLNKIYSTVSIDANQYIVKNFYQKDVNLTKDGWSMKYNLTTLDGLEIKNLKYNGKNVARSLKIINWYLPYKDISVNQVNTSVVLAFNAPKIKEFKEKNGFYIIQDFKNPKSLKTCDYLYENRYEFYKDGSFKILALGKACNNKSIYHPIMRLDITLNDNKEQFALYNGQDWDNWQIERRYKSTNEEKMYKDKYLYRVNNPQNPENGYYIEPNRGQYNNSQSDNEIVYVSKFKDNESNKTLLIYNDNLKEFIKNKELIENSDTVMWYIPTIQNNDKNRYKYCSKASTIDKNGKSSAKVCTYIAGVKFVPILKVDK